MVELHKRVYKPIGEIPQEGYALLAFAFENTLSIDKNDYDEWGNTYDITFSNIVDRLGAYISESKVPVVMCIFCDSNDCCEESNEHSPEDMSRFIETLKKTDVYEKLLNIFTFHAPNKSEYYKPSLRVYDLVVEDLSTQPRVKTYIGSNAGRAGDACPQVGARRRDMSCVDIHFAENCGMKFLTPEEFFYGDNTKECCKYTSKECPRLSRYLELVNSDRN